MKLKDYVFVAHDECCPHYYSAGVVSDSDNASEHVMRWLNDGRCVKRVVEADARMGLRRYAELWNHGDAEKGGE